MVSTNRKTEGLGAAAIIWLAAAACGGTTDTTGTVCGVVGQREPCDCRSAPDGTRTCGNDGSWTECDCDAPFVAADGGDTNMAGTSGSTLGGLAGRSEAGGLTGVAGTAGQGSTGSGGGSTGGSGDGGGGEPAGGTSGIGAIGGFVAVGGAGQAGTATGGIGGSTIGGGGAAGAVGTGGTTGGVAGTSGVAGTTGGAGTPQGTGGVVGSGGVGDGGGGGSDGDGPSCANLTGTECNGESCCTSIVVPGGGFLMGRGTEVCDGCVDGCPSGMDCFSCPGTDPCYNDEQPEHPATVSSFALDKYEVTVGRFRAFVNEYDGTPPPAGAGAHPLIPDSGWDTAWNDRLSEDRAALIENLHWCEASGTWTDTPGGNETRPITCVTHAEAFAFCYWDGGRLPTEAEWEYVAAGGDENRVFPWGNDVSEPLPCDYWWGSDRALIAAPVGSYPAGNGRWGHSDLAGGVNEVVRDEYYEAQYLVTEDGCTDCAHLVPGPNHVIRGGSWSEPAVSARAAHRYHTGALSRTARNGIRCARAP